MERKEIENLLNSIYSDPVMSPREIKNKILAEFDRLNGEIDRLAAAQKSEHKPDPKPADPFQKMTDALSKIREIDDRTVAVQCFRDNNPGSMSLRNLSLDHNAAWLEQQIAWVNIMENDAKRNNEILATLKSIDWALDQIRTQ